MTPRFGDADDDAAVCDSISAMIAPSSPLGLWPAGAGRAAYWSSARLRERFKRETLWTGVEDDDVPSLSSSSWCPRRSRRAFWLAFFFQALWEPGFLPMVIG